MSMNASVSVVIPCYNAEKTIERTLDSVLTQSLLPYEIIIVDDKSTDKSCQVIKNYIEKCKDQIKIILIEQKDNAGPAKARNTGWDYANGEYIAFLDADDSWYSQKIEFQYSYMRENPDVSLTGHLYEVLTGNDSPLILPIRLTDNIKNFSKIKFLIRNWFGTSTVMLKRNIPLRFREFKKYAEDYLLWAEIKFSGYNCTLLSLPLSLYKMEYGGSGLSGNMLAMWKGGLKNLNILYKEGYIGVFVYIFFIFFVTFKLALRIIKKSLLSFLRK